MPKTLTHEEVKVLASASSDGGSRTFAGTFVISWIPSQTEPTLTVTVKAAESLLYEHNFNPDDTIQSGIKVDNDTHIFQGTLIALFDASGMHGHLSGDKLIFTVKESEPTHFSGLIGLW